MRGAGSLAVARPGALLGPLIITSVLVILWISLIDKTLILRRTYPLIMSHI